MTKAEEADLKARVLYLEQTQTQIIAMLASSAILCNKLADICDLLEKRTSQNLKGQFYASN